jgi:competence protein ComEC
LDLFSPRRSLETALKWSKTDQVLFIFLGFFKNALALTLATSIVALPLSLYYFQLFAFLSLFYNLFFPFLVSLSMGTLLLGLLLSPFPYLGRWVHGANDYLTSFFLNMTYDLPDSWDISLRIEAFPIYLAIICLVLLFALAIYYRKTENISI